MTVVDPAGTNLLHGCSAGHDFQGLYVNTTLYAICRRCGWNFPMNNGKTRVIDDSVVEP